MRQVIHSLIACCRLVIGGCNQQAQPQAITPAEWASLQTQIGVLTSQIQALNDTIDAIPPPVPLSTDVQPAFVSVIDPGYGLARTKLGLVTVSVEGVEKYLDGYKLRLELGNLTSATLGGVKPHVEWGKYVKGTFARRNHDFDITKNLLPGVYTVADVRECMAKAHFAHYPHRDPLSLRENLTSIRRVAHRDRSPEYRT